MVRLIFCFLLVQIEVQAQKNWFEPPKIPSGTTFLLETQTLDTPRITVEKIRLKYIQQISDSIYQFEAVPELLQSYRYSNSSKKNELNTNYPAVNTFLKGNKTLDSLPENFYWNIQSGEIKLVEKNTRDSLNTFQEHLLATLESTLGIIQDQFDLGRNSIFSEKTFFRDFRSTTYDSVSFEIHSDDSKITGQGYFVLDTTSGMLFNGHQKLFIHQYFKDTTSFYFQISTLPSETIKISGLIKNPASPVVHLHFLEHHFNPVTLPNRLEQSNSFNFTLTQINPVFIEIEHPVFTSTGELKARKYNLIALPGDSLVVTIDDEQHLLVTGIGAGVAANKLLQQFDSLTVNLIEEEIPTGWEPLQYLFQHRDKEKYLAGLDKLERQMNHLLEIARPVLSEKVHEFLKQHVKYDLALERLSYPGEVSSSAISTDGL
jgi:hypothetical protein